MAHTRQENVIGQLGLRKRYLYVAFWEKEHPRNLAVGCQKLYGSNKKGFVS